MLSLSKVLLQFCGEEKRLEGIVEGPKPEMEAWHGC